MKRICLALLFAALLPATLMGQAKKPTIMVIPADVWCTQNGYMTTFENQGETVKTPDYQRALQENVDLVNVITKIGELMADRGLPLKDLAANLRSLRQQSAENAMLASRTSGAELAESPYDLLMRRAKADILVELTWTINSVGPRRSVTYTLRGLDAYTNKQVAATQGTGEPSLTAETPLLLEEAVVGKMDAFVAQLQAHFDDLLANGREVAIDVRLFDTGSGLSLEEEFDGEELSSLIENWMAEHTVQHRFSTTDVTENVMTLEQVRIPLYADNGMPLDTRRFARELAKYLQQPPIGITSKVVSNGLGKCTIILGEK